MNILTPSELAETDDDMSYHVRGLLPMHALATLWAPSGIGKTFVMLDLSLHIAAGMPWHGYEVTRGAVLYCVGEGFAGMHARVHAWCTEHHVDPRDLDAWIGFRRVPFDITDAEMHRTVREELESKQLTPSLVVLDTLSANAPSGFDESKTAAMKMLLDGARAMRDDFGCSVLFIHHTGWDETRERGSSDLRAAMDVSLSLKAIAGDVRELRVEKARDFTIPDPFRLVLRTRHGARVVEPMRANDEELTPSQRAILLVLAEQGQGDPVKATAWERATGYEGSTFYRVRGQLEKLKLILKSAKGYVLTEGGKSLVDSMLAASLLESLPHSHVTPMHSHESGDSLLPIPLSTKGECGSNPTQAAA